ncbi:MAG: NUDIX domain-containing protein [Mycobacteriales bacterium]
MTDLQEPLDRRAARVLLIDRDSRVLLFHGRDPVDDSRGRWWFTPGGGLDEGETPAEGAARELLEETGLVVDPAALGPVVHRRVTVFPWGEVTYRQEEDYFVLRIDAHEVDTSGFNEVEVRAVLGHRWWSVPELAATAETYYPRELLELLPC